MTTTKTSKTTPAGITLLPYADRVKLVRARLSDMRLHREFTPLPKSAKVRAAEATIQEWVARNDTHREAHYAAMKAKRHEIEDALILGDVQKAVKLLAALGA